MGRGKSEDMNNDGGGYKPQRSTFERVASAIFGSSKPEPKAEPKKEAPKKAVTEYAGGVSSKTKQALKDAGAD